MSETALLYFFSALAQSAAAFAAIVAVFAVFRLQANQGLVRERYAEANDAFYAGWHYRVADSRLKADLKYKAYEAKGDSEEDKKQRVKAEEVLTKIEEAEALNRRLADELGLPLKMWVGIFLLSLAMFGVVKFCQGWLGTIIAGAFVVGAAVAVWQTKTFIQRCLHL